MLRITRPEVTSSVKGSVTSMTLSDSKKYTKRRYTDSRHQTRHIPDAETLVGKTSSTTISSSSVSSTSNSQSVRGSSAAPVWKRRELISSAPKNREGYF